MGKNNLFNKSNFKFKYFITPFAVFVVLAITSAMYFTGSLRESSADLLAQVGYSIILVVSLNLVVGFLGELSLGHAGFMCVGAYLGTYISNSMYANTNLPAIAILLITMLICGIVASLFGFVIGLPALRLKGDYLAIVTLAFGEIVRILCMNITAFGGARGLRNANVFESYLFVIVGVFTIITIILIQNFIRSKHGRAVMAIRDNEIAAKAMGVNVTKYKLLVFVFSAFFAGIAGVFYGAGNTPIKYGVFSYNYSIEILVMVVLGGMGSLGGSVIAATAVPIINYVLQDKLSSFAAFKLIIYALILIAIVIYTNAPKLKNFRTKYNLRNGFDALSKKIDKVFRKKDIDKAKEQAKEKEFGAEWSRIPTKIEMDAVLSTDFKPDNSYVQDKADTSKNK